MNEMIVMQVSQPVDHDGYLVHRLMIEQPNFSHRLTLRKGKELDQLLDETLAETALHFLRLSELSTGGVVRDDGLIIELPGAVVGRISIISGSTNEKERRATVRFSFFVGNANALLKSKDTLNSPIVEVKERADLEALIDFCLPTIEILKANAGFRPEELGASVVNINIAHRSENALRELRFYLLLLQRFIESSLAYAKFKNMYSVEVLGNYPFPVPDTLDLH
ncbi:MAG: hypothetical protein AAF340_17985 [Pseudomonadota bacterium]